VISIILPTYNEAENIRILVPRISMMLDEQGLEGEIIVVDDDSPDGTAHTAEGLAEAFPLRVHVRRHERGLARAVIEGLELSKGDVCVIMDADLSHPVEKVPDLVRPILERRCDVTVGSRYMRGGGVEAWPLVRRLISKGAGLLARGLSPLSDPTSGFMAVRRSLVDGVDLDPSGWKIVLEIMVKAEPRFMEIPIVFSDRKRGQSKLGLKAQIDYLRHLFRLYGYRYPGLRQFMRFCIVGLSGLLVDTLVLVAFVDFLFFDPRSAAVLAFLGAVTWNYIWDRIWTFEYGRRVSISTSYLSFVGICLFGLGVRIGIMHLLIEYVQMGERPWYILASLLGILAATVFNFLGSKYVAFSRLMNRHRGLPF